MQQNQRPEQVATAKGAPHLGPVLRVYMCPPPSPAQALSFTVAAKKKTGRLPGVMVEQREERGSGTRGGERMELVFFGSERMWNGAKRRTMLGMKEEIGGLIGGI